MENNEKLICGLSSAQILQLKEKHGFLILGEVQQAGTTYQAVFREPDFKTLEATGAVGEKNAIKGTIALFDNCVIASDPELSQRDFLKLKAVECLAQHMNSFNVTVKNL